MTAFPLRAQSDARSHPGQVRDANEDSFACLEREGLWAVADGMGGHAHGAWASSVLIETLREDTLADGFEAARDEVAGRIHRANRAIFDEAGQRDSSMGSTIVALLARERRFAVLWVGDSRAYLLRQGALYQLSSDHSQVQEMVERGLLTPAEIEGHPMSHVLVRAVGMAPAVEVDVVEDEIEPGDIFLLCSDGLHGAVGREDIAGLLTQADTRQIADDLLVRTMARGAPDNVTVVVIQFSEPTLVPSPVPVDAS